MLNKIRVLDFSTNGAGPMAAAALADYGADVIKIEKPVVGDDSRAFPPFADDSSMFFWWCNRGKRSVVMDLQDPEAIKVLERMILDADVIVESFRPGVMKRHGLNYDRVIQIKPDIIYCSVTAFGQKGAYASRPGYDLLAQALSGIMSVTGEPDGPPVKSGTALGDSVGGLNAFSAIMTALYYRSVSGEGQHIDIALVNGLIWVNSCMTSAEISRTSGRTGNHHATLAPYGLFNGNDRESIVIATANDKMWRLLCDAMGKAELKNAPEFLSLAERVRNKDALVTIIEDWLRQFPTVDEALAVLLAHSVPAARVYSCSDVIQDKHFIENGWIAETAVPEGVHSMNHYYARGVNAHFSKRPGKVGQAPALGQHTKEVLGAYQLSGHDIERLQGKWDKKYTL